MTTLAGYLAHKRDAFRALRSRVLPLGYEPAAAHAHVATGGGAAACAASACATIRC
jgi:hypothetical protein